MHQFAGYLLQEHAFDDAVSAIWHATIADAGSPKRAADLRPGTVAGEQAPWATLRIFDLPEGRAFSGPLFALREDVEAAARLHHPNVLEARDVGRHGVHTYVVNRHTRAVPLSDHLQRPLTPAQALELLGPLADALDAASRRDLAHGAVHPRSIWVESDRTGAEAPRALLSGFGLHHVLRVLAVRRRSSDVVDDFLYIAPELVRGGRPTNRSDQYALAAAVLHATTGNPPFERDGLTALFDAQRFSAPPGMGRDIDVTADAGRALDEIMSRALDKNPDRRFDTCRDFVAAVTAWDQDHRSAVTAPAPSAPAPRSSPATTVQTAGVAPSKQSSHAAPGPPSRARSTRRRRSRLMTRGATALATAGVMIGIVAALVLLAGLRSPAPQDELLAAASATASGSGSPGVHWRHTLDSQAIGVYVVPAGVVAVTPEQVVVLEPETGRVRATLDGRQASAAVTADGALLTAGADGMRMRDVADRTVEWTSAVSGAGAPEVLGQTIYRVSNTNIPRLVATAAGSGQRLWQFPEDEPAFPAQTAVAPAADFVYLADDETLHGVLPEGASIDTDTAVIDAGDKARKALRVWRTRTDEPLWVSSLRAVADGVMAADRSGDVCLRGHADGAVTWCVPVRGVADAEPALLTGDDSVYVVTDAAVTALEADTGGQRWMRAGAWRTAVMADDGRLIAVDATGQVSVLAAETGDIHPLDAVRVPSEATLTAAGDALYAAGPEGELISVDLADSD